MWRKLTTKPSTIWSSKMEKLGIGVININTDQKVWSPMECMLLTNQRITDFGLSGDAKTRRAVPAKNPLLPRVQPNEPSQLHLRLTILLLWSFFFSNPFKWHWLQLLVFLKMNSTRFGPMLAVSQEDWEYNRHFHFAYHILNSGCHFYPTTASSLFNMHGQVNYLLQYWFYSRYLSVDIFSLTDCNFELRRMVLVVYYSSCVYSPNKVLHFLLGNLWFWT